MSARRITAVHAPPHDPQPRHQRQPTRCERILAATAATDDPARMLQAVAHEVFRVGLFRRLTASLVDLETGVVSVVVTCPARAEPVLGDGTDRAARTGLLQVADIGTESRSAQPRGDVDRGDGVAYFIPIRRVDRVVAVLATASGQRERAASLRRIEALGPALSQVAVGLEFASRLKAERSRADAVAAVGRLAGGLRRQEVLADLLDRVGRVRCMADLAGALDAIHAGLTTAGIAADGCAVYLLAEGGRTATCWWLRRPGPVAVCRRAWPPREPDPVVDACRTSLPVLRRLHETDLYGERPGLERCTGRPIRCAVDVPFRAGHHVAGTLSVDSVQPEAFDAAGLAFLECLARIVAGGWLQALVCHGAADATDLPEAIAPRRQPESRSPAVLDGNRVPILALAEDDRIVAANPAAGRFLGRAEGSLAGVAIDALLDPGERLRWPRLRRTAPFAAELSWRHAAGDRLETAVDAASVRSLGRDLLQLIVVDTGSAVWSRERRRRSLQLQEVERGRLARELHDGVNQVLTASAAQLHLARLSLRRGDGGAEGALEQAHDYLHETIWQVRRIAGDLRPAVLDDLGLAAALRSLARRAGDRRAARVEVDVDDLPEVDPDRAAAIYWIVREAVANAVRHAAPTVVTIAATGDGRTRNLEVHDDGAGFDVEALLRRSGAGDGLASMRDRAEVMDLELHVDSAPGRGTTVRLVLTD